MQKLKILSNKIPSCQKYSPIENEDENERNKESCTGCKYLIWYFLTNLHRENIIVTKVAINDWIKINWRMNNIKNNQLHRSWDNMYRKDAQKDYH